MTDYDDIRRALEAATPGKWCAAANCGIRVIGVGENASQARENMIAQIESDEDADLIALLRNNAEAILAMRAIEEIVELWFAPWGAAKGEMWEDLSGDRPFDPNVALELIRDALRTSADPASSEKDSGK